MEDSSSARVPTPGVTPAPGPPMAAASRLALERSLMTQELFSPRAIDIIQASRRPATNRIYDSTWKSFCYWCRRHQLDISKLSISQIVEFLLEGLDKGLAPATIRRQVAALSTILTCTDSGPLAHHPRIRAFIKGACNTRPPVVHRYPSWNLPRVLRALTKPPFEPLSTIPLRSLSLKVAFLIAITSARRISELAALSIREDLCIFHSDRVVLRLDPTFVPKVNSLFHRAQEVILPNFCPDPSHDLERQWHKLDVRRVLRRYIKRTAPFRRSEALFVSFRPATLGQKVSAGTVGRWIRNCIAEAYQSSALPAPSHITAHSTRSAATSAAWATQAPIEEICRAATWSSPSPFVRHYRIDRFASADAAFGRRVLQQVVSDDTTLGLPVPHP